MDFYRYRAASRRNPILPLTLIVCAVIVSTFTFTDIGRNQSGNPGAVALSSSSKTESPHTSLSEEISRSGAARAIISLSTEVTGESTLSSWHQVVDQRLRIVRDQRSIASVLARHNISVDRSFSFIPAIAATVDRDALEDLIDNDLVEHIELDVLARPALADSNATIGADVLHEAGITGSGADVGAVAILDSGIDSAHPMFQGSLGSKVVGEACFSTTNTVAESLCPSGLAQEFGPGSGVDCSLDYLGCGHGTHVAGIAAGSPTTFPDGTVGSGVAYGAPLISVSVFSLFSDPNPLYCGLMAPCILSYTSDQIAALEHVYALSSSTKISAVNMSLGGAYSSSPCTQNSKRQIIQLLYNANIPVFAAAGNLGSSNQITEPACIPEVIAVSSINHKGEVSKFSDTHPSMVDIYAPGSMIQSAYPGGYIRMSGTSMASPMVAGSYLLLKELFPEESVSDLEYRLTTAGAGSSIREDPFGSEGLDLGFSIPTLRVDISAGLSDAEWLPYISRIGGSDRFETSVLISQANFPDGAEAVFITTGREFADALSVGPIAGSMSSPVLLTEGGSAGVMPAAVVDELKRLDPQSVIVVGGEQAISSTQVSQLFDLGFDVERIAGDTRFGTSSALSRHRFKSTFPDTVFIASGRGYADALSVGVIAGLSNSVVLLSEASFVPDEIRGELSRLAPDHIVVVGGTAAISEAAFEDLRTFSSSIERIAGDNRFATSAAIIQRLFAGEYSEAIIASGLSFPDALSGIPSAVTNGAPIVLSQTSCVPENILDELRRLKTKEVRLLGGPAALDYNVLALSPC